MKTTILIVDSIDGLFELMRKVNNNDNAELFLIEARPLDVATLEKFFEEHNPDHILLDSSTLSDREQREKTKSFFARYKYLESKITVLNPFHYDRQSKLFSWMLSIIEECGYKSKYRMSFIPPINPLLSILMKD